MGVTVYTTKTCPFCYMEKRFLKKNKIEYEEIDVSRNRESAREMIQKSGHTGVPQTDINGKMIVGFNKEALIKELGL